MKQQILELIPGIETELIEAVNNVATKEELLGVLVRAFGLDKPNWDKWQLAIEQVYLSNPGAEL